MPYQRPDLSVYQRRPRQGGNFNLGTVANLVTGISDRINAKKEGQAIAEREKNIDDIYRRNFEGYNPQAIKDFKQSGYAGPPQPGYNERMMNIEGEMFQKYPSSAIQMRQNRLKNEATNRMSILESKKREAEIANQLLTNKDLALKYQNSQQEVIGDILSNIKDETQYQVGKKMVKEIDPELNLPNTYREAQSFLKVYPKVQDTIIKRNNLYLEGESKRQKMDLDQKRFDFEKQTKLQGESRDKIKDRREFKKSFNQDTRVKSFNEVDSSFERMKAVWENRPDKENPNTKKKRAGIDQALITLYNKMLDPGSVVRESEYARTPDNTPIINRAVGKLNQVITGGAGITDADRQEIFDTAKRLFDSSKSRYSDILLTYGSDAMDSGYELDKIFTDRDRDLLGEKMNFVGPTQNKIEKLSYPKLDTLSSLPWQNNTLENQDRSDLDFIRSRKK